jgi:ABC-type dipeptide/oligopeptide/nickel transport system permease component
VGVNSFTTFVLGILGGAVGAVAGIWIGLLWYFNRNNPM